MQRRETKSYWQNSMTKLKSVPTADVGTKAKLHVHRVSEKNIDLYYWL